MRGCATWGRSLVRNERGMALAVAVFAMVIIAALVAGTFFAAFAHVRMSRSGAYAAAAFQAADAGLDQAVANWDPFSVDTLTVQNSMTLAGGTLATGQSYTPAVTRLSGTLFRVQSLGTTTVGGTVQSSRLLATLVRKNPASVDVKGAITVRGSIKISGSSQINGTDLVPANWGAVCNGAGAGVAGVRDSTSHADSANQIQTSGACSGATCITGNPKILVDTTVSTKTFTQFGDLSFTDLAAMADKTLPGGTYNGIGPTYNAPVPPSTTQTCRRTDLSNWGAPTAVSTNACFNYFPIIYSSGDLHLTGGTGQGILLVDGDFTVDGGFEFYGPVIVKGTASSQGTGGHIYGGLLAGNADLSLTTITGNSVVDYSACALQRAVLGTSRVKPLKNHAWGQLR